MQTPTSTGSGTSPEARFMYIGPNVVGAGLLHGSVWIGGIPSHLDEYFRECRAMKQLFVELDMQPGQSKSAAPLLALESKSSRQSQLAADVIKWLEAKSTARAQRN